MRFVFLSRNWAVAILDEDCSCFESRDGRTFYRSAFDGSGQVAYNEQIPANLEIIARNAMGAFAPGTTGG
jgi:hypothetical protein